MTTPAPPWPAPDPDPAADRLFSELPLCLPEDMRARSLQRHQD